MIATGCAVGSGAVVKGAGPDDLLKLREGPGLNHKIIIGLPDGTRRAIAISAGIAWIESADVAYDELLQCADFTLYKAKKTAKGGYCISDEDDGERARPMEADA